MANRRNVKLYIKLILLLLCFIVVMQIFFLAISRYESSSSSNADIDIAFYLFNEDYQEMTLNLGEIVPNGEEHTYNFSVSNNKDDKMAEVDIEYELVVKATTNLPLEYRFFKETDGDRVEATEEVIQDEYGTYFKTFKIDKQTFTYTTPRVDNYTLTITFPEQYNHENYQDILDMIEVSVEAKQIIDEA